VEHPDAVERSPDALAEHQASVECNPDAQQERQDAVVPRSAALSIPVGVERVEATLEIRVSLQPLQASPEPHGTQAE
jgi:hypothetical protein